MAVSNSKKLKSAKHYTSFMKISRLRNTATSFFLAKCMRQAKEDDSQNADRIRRILPLPEQIIQTQIKWIPFLGEQSLKVQPVYCRWQQ
jgi:hypothetical protein